MAVAVLAPVPAVPGPTRLTRKERRRQKHRARLPISPSRSRRVAHDCSTWHSRVGLAAYAQDASRCPVHHGLLVDVGEFRRYPRAICYACLPPHGPRCPMNDASVLLACIAGRLPVTCVCPPRLKVLGLQLVKVRGALSGSGVRPIAVAAAR